MNTPDRVYTTSEIAELLKVDRSTVVRWIQQDKLRGTVVGSSDYRVTRQALAAFVGVETARDLGLAEVADG